MTTESTSIIHDLLEPLRAREAELNEQMKQKEDELAALKAERVEVRRVLNAANTDPNRKKPGPKKTTAAGERVAADTLDAAYAWLVANYDGQDITAGAIRNDPSFTVVSGNRVNDVLAALKDRGVLRLDRVGGTRGRQKYYKVVRDAQS